MAEEIWVKIQRKTFARWVDNIVQTKGLSCSDKIEDELRDGVLLHTLLTVCTGKVLPKITPKPKVQIQKMENVTKIFKWMTQTEGIKLPNTGSEDIYGGKTKYVLGLIWTLILYFQLDSSEDEEELGMSMRSALLEWCNNVLQPQGITVRNFTENWKDGRAFCGLVNALQPNTIPLAECPPDNAISNLNRAFDNAHNLFQIPKILEADDMIQYQDELSIITYVSYFRGYLSKHAAYAHNTYAEGPGLVEALNNKPAHFTIIACDQQGNRVDRGGAFIRLSLKEKKTNKECGRFTIKDNLNGTYSCTYETEKYGTKGNFELHIKVGSTSIRDSPFYPEIIPNEADPSKCVAFGTGISFAKAGTKTDFTVQTKDLKGDPLTKGGTIVISNIQDGSHTIPVTIVDNNDGTYTCSYATETASDVQLNVLIKTQSFGTGPIAGSPFTVKVGPGVASGKNTIAKGDGTKHATAGQITDLSVITYDRFGNQVKEGGALINGEITMGDISLPLDIIDNNDGTYTVNYTPLKTGNYRLNLRVDNEPIKGAPFTVKVDPGVVDIENTEITFLDRPVAGVCGATLQMLDEHQNIYTLGGEHVVAECIPLSSFFVPAVDNGDGSYDIVYPPHARGKYRVDVNVNGNPAPNGPWEVEVKENPLKPNVIQQVTKLMPKSATVLERLLAKTTEKEQQIILSELEGFRK